MQYRPYTGTKPRPLASLVNARPEGSPWQPHLPASTYPTTPLGGHPWQGWAGGLPQHTGVTSTPAAAPPASTGGTPAAGADPYASDPIYQQIVALANTNESQARASAEAARKQLVIGLGDPALAQQLGLGQAVADTAQAAPFSVLKNLLRGHNQGVRGIDTGANHANLTYSSAHDQALQGEQTGYQGQKASAYQQAQNGLTGIANALLAAIQAGEAQKLGAAGDAYGRHRNDVQPPSASDQAGQNDNPAQAFYRLILGQAYQRAQNPKPRGPSGGL